MYDVDTSYWMATGGVLSGNKRGPLSQEDSRGVVALGLQHIAGLSALCSGTSCSKGPRWGTWVRVLLASQAKGAKNTANSSLEVGGKSLVLSQSLLSTARFSACFHFLQNRLKFELCPPPNSPLCSSKVDCLIKFIGYKFGFCQQNSTCIQSDCMHCSGILTAMEVSCQHTIDATADLSPFAASVNAKSVCVHPLFQWTQATVALQEINTLPNPLSQSSTH